MKPARTILLAVCVLVLATLACGPFGGSTDDEPTPTFPPTRTPVPVEEEEPTPVPEKPADTPEPTPQEEDPSQETEDDTPPTKGDSDGATLLITNESPMTVYYLFISSSDSDEWGEDMLGEDVLDPGDSYLFTDIPPGDYDIKAEDLDENVIEIAWEEYLDGDVELTITGLGVVHVYNDSDETIDQIFMSSVESTTWGADWLGGDTIEPGESHTFYEIEPGYYDAKASNADDDSIEILYNVAIFGEQEWWVVSRTPIPDNGVVRFEDDFSDNRNNWGNVDTEHTNYMAPADGEYCILIKSADNTAWEWYEPFRTDEFIAEVSCEVTGDEDASCGLGFGPDGDNLFWFEVSAYDQTFALFLLEDDEWQDSLIEWTESKYINPNAPNYLSLERVDDVISLYINGFYAGDAYYEGFPEGRIGLGGSTYNDQNATVCLDNLTVFRLE